MTPAERQLLAEAIEHHNNMVALYQDVWRMRERGDDPLESPAAREAIGLSLKVEPLRKALAAFSVREMDKENMAPYFVSQELLSTMRTLIVAFDAAKRRHIPQRIQPDGIPESYRKSFVGGAP
ncbi:hypothetical protein SAMN05216452_3200 [Nitratireductor aquibiodomus]|uniref:Uncharacterized protein n=1 Tax=Nitratireductor aquibiodomus TaxID=204799 RepID=A0A1H4M9G8_9HYPH|nr:hypothetical protein [Nitratireductor aquibiodomus]SEB79394.1 hypothetical protein SAMN05216452_3200 [Nitratireductor aquibiodomus]